MVLIDGESMGKMQDPVKNKLLEKEKGGQENSKPPD